MTSRTHAAGAVCFALLCVLASSRWLLESSLPLSGSTLRSQAFGCVLAAGLLGAISLKTMRTTRSLTRKWTLFRVLGYTFALTGPAFAEATAGRHLGSSNWTLASALVPVVVTVGVAISHESGEGDLIGTLWPGLAGLTGLLLLLSEPAVDWRGWAGLAMLPLLTGLGAVLAGSGAAANPDAPPDAGPVGATWVVPGGCLGAGLVFALLAPSRPDGSVWSLSASSFDAMTFFLTMVSLERLGPARWSAQFLLVPLLALGEGLLVLRPFMDVRSWVGLVLIAISGGRLLFAGRHAGAPQRLLSASTTSPRS